MKHTFLCFQCTSVIDGTLPNWKCESTETKCNQQQWCNSSDPALVMGES